MRLSPATTGSADAWDEVWAEYDARHPAPHPRPGPPLASPGDRSRSSPGTGRRLGRWVNGAVLLLGLGTAVAGYAAVPLRHSQAVADAVRLRDGAALAALVDWEAVAAGLARPVPRPVSPPAGARAGPPPRAAAEGAADAQAAAWLDRLSATVARGAATPEGFIALAQARLPPGPLDPWLEPTGPGSARVAFRAPARDGPGLALHLSRQEALRWAVVRVEALE